MSEKVRGIVTKEKNGKRIAVGIHCEGLDNILSFFGVSDELRRQVLLSCKMDWVNVSLIRRDEKHPAGFTHFCVLDGANETKDVHTGYSVVKGPTKFGSYEHVIPKCN